MTSNPSSILDSLRDELWEIPRKAQRLPWGDIRRWTFKTHLWIEQEDDKILVVIDLHDLNVKIARDVVYQSIKKMSTLVGAICFITGKGNHSAGGPKILPMAIDISQNQADKNGWRVQSQPGKVFVIYDESKAPTIVTGELSRTIVWGVYLFFALLAMILIRALITA